MRGGVLAGVASGALLVSLLGVSVSLLLPPPGPAGLSPQASDATTTPPTGSGNSIVVVPPGTTRTVARVGTETMPNTTATVPDAETVAAPDAARPVPKVAITGSASTPVPRESMPVPAGSEFGRKPEDAAATLPRAEAIPTSRGVTGGLDQTLAIAEGGTILALPTGSAVRPAPPPVASIQPAPPEPEDSGRPVASQAGTPRDGVSDAAASLPIPATPSEGETALNLNVTTSSESAAAIPSLGAIAIQTPGKVAAVRPIETPPKDVSPPRTRVEIVPPADVLSPPPAQILPEAEALLEDGSVASGGGDPLPRRLVLDNTRNATTSPEATDMAASVVTGALAQNAVPFDGTSGLPRLAIVLIDAAPGSGRAPTDGDPAAADRAVDTIGPGALAGLDLVVTVAIDPARADSADAARAWHAAGHEVVLLATTPIPGATPQDIEVAFAGARAAMPQAIGLLDGAQGDATDGVARAAILPVLAEAGMGFVGPADGLGSDVVAARGRGVPATSLYRMLDDADESVPVIVRYLDRAAFEADRTGAIVVAGHATARMIAALRDWNEGDRAKTVATAPLSAVLTDPRLEP